MRLITSKWLRYVTLLFVCLPVLLWTQDSLQWRTIDAGNSREEFEKLRALQYESTKWDIPDRIDFSEKLYNAAKSIQNDTLIVLYGEDLAVFYLEMDSFSVALQILNEAINYVYDPFSEQLIYTALGILHKDNDDSTTALDYYHLSYETVKGDSTGTGAYPLLNMANIYRDLGDYENAVKYSKYSILEGSRLAVYEKEYNLLFNHSYLLECYQKLGDSASAIATIDSILHYIREIDNLPSQKYRDGVLVGYYFIADYYLETAAPYEAEGYIKKAREFAQSFYYSEVDVLEVRRLILLDDFENALSLINRTFPDSSTDTEEILGLKAQCLKALGRHREALALIEAKFELFEEKSKKEQIRYSKFADAKYESLQKSEEIKALSKEKQIQSLTIKNQRYILFLGLLLFLLLAGLILFTWKQYKDRKQLNIQLQEQVMLKTKHLQKANEELRILNYIASHDIKEPIRNIGSISGLIRHKLPVEEYKELGPYFDIITNSTKQLYSLVEDIGKFLSLSQEGKVEFVELDLTGVVENIKNSLAHNIKAKNVRITTNQLPLIISNPTAIYVLVKNLIENGIKFNVAEQPFIEVNYHRLGNNHRITVRDNGIGIDKAYHTIIFSPFKRLNDRNQFSGSGIGLAIVKLIVDNLQGTIAIESEIDQGSTFIVEFPILSSAQEQNLQFRAVGLVQ